MSVSVAVWRNPSRARLLKMRSAHGNSSAALAGVQLKMRSRLAMLPLIPVGSYGPVTSKPSMRGTSGVPSPGTKPWRM
jgi:hypothetical protein